jgi:hypothetical protein
MNDLVNPLIKKGMTAQLATRRAFQDVRFVPKAEIS